MKDKKGQSALKWIFEVAGGQKLNILLLALIQTGLSLLGLWLALMFRQVVNAAVGRDMSEFASSSVIAVVILAIQTALGAGVRFLREYTSASMENRFKHRLFSQILNRDYAAVTAVHSGEWMNRLSSDTKVAADNASSIFPDLIGMLVRLVGAVCILICLIPDLVWLIIPVGALFVLFTYLFRKKLKRLHKLQQEADGKVRVHFLERLSSLLIVHSFSKERQSADEADEKMQAHKNARMRRSNFSNICNIGFGAIMSGAYILGVVFCGHKILHGEMSFGSLVAVMQLIGQIQSPLSDMTGYIPKYFAMTASAERLMEAEKWAYDISGERKSDAEIAELYDNSFVGINFRDAVFSYHRGDEICPSVSCRDFSVKKGEYIAVTGESGCGKSTLLKLMMCLYPLDSGSRELETKTGKEKLGSQWRGLYAYVPQGNQLMAGTIREIVAFGDSEKMKDTKSIERALEIACALEFVTKLADGTDTVLGERGSGLSEGQMQRIAIARAICSGHPILLLDEATSSLDEETERKLLTNIRTVTDRTVVIVTHRMAVLSICDKRIIMGKQGMTCEKTEER